MVTLGNITAEIMSPKPGEKTYQSSAFMSLINLDRILYLLCSFKNSEFSRLKSFNKLEEKDLNNRSN